MEGICGIISFSADCVDIQGTVGEMIQCLSDGETLSISTLNGKNWSFACAGWEGNRWQPLTFTYQENTLAIAGLADVYNLRELSAKLSTPLDNIGAAVAKCYRSSGTTWPLHLRGNFAIIIVDLEKQKLLAATDRVGISPIYWSKQGASLYLSSRLGAIHHVCRNLQISSNAIYAYMYHSMIPSPLTVYENVYKLEPGHILIADRDEWRVKQYWDISVSPKLTKDKAAMAREVFDSIERSVSLMKNGVARETELACFLSGGTDSSSICGLLSQANEVPVQAYSVGFPENGYDEMNYARVAAGSFGLSHHELYIKPGDLFKLLPRIVAAYDEPFGNASAIPTLYCAGAAAQNGVRYMFAGDGGDEIFAGNERYGTQQVFRNYFKIPRTVRTVLIEPLVIDRIDRLPIDIFRKAGSYIRKANLPEVERLNAYCYVTDEEMFNADFLNTCGMDTIREISNSHFNRLSEASMLDRHLYLDMKLTITDNDLRKVTRMCELGGVRVRYPMLDHPVIELGFRIPVELKLKGRKGLRYIFKRAFKDLLPGEILIKHKHGFGLPISQWLRRDKRIKRFAYELLFDSKKLMDHFFRPEFFSRLWQLQLNDNTSYYGSIVWQLVMLVGWYNVHEKGNSL